MIGLGLISVLTFPEKLYAPFLLDRINSRSCATLCRTCCEKKNLGVCEHTEKERTLTSTYTIPELNYAHSLGYRFVFHELLLYPGQDFILADYIRFLGYHKLKNSGFGSHQNPSCEQKEEYVQHLNATMNFAKIGKQLTVADITENRSARLFYKMALNTCLGKLGQKDIASCTRIVSTAAEIDTALASDRLTDISVINENHCQITLSAEEAKYPCRTGSVVHGAYTTACSRVYIHKQMMNVINSGAKLFYVNTDALYFAVNEASEKPFPIKMGSSFGEFSDIYKNSDIKHFCCVSPKCYSLVYQQADGQMRNEVKVSGLSLNTNWATLGHADFEQRAKQLIKKTIGEVSAVSLTTVPQVRLQRTSLVSGKYTQRRHTFSKNFHAYRKLEVTEEGSELTFNSRPFGFDTVQKLSS